MSLGEESQRFSVIWQTIAAAALSLAAYVLASFVVNAFVVITGLLNFTDDQNARSLWIDFARSISPSLVGVICAKSICDRLLSIYSRQAIFFFFVLIAVPGVLMAFREIGRPWEATFSFISSTTTVGGAYYWFWKNGSVS